MVAEDFILKIIELRGVLVKDYIEEKGTYMKEEWRDITEFECNYQVSNLGRVRNKKTKRMMNPFVATNGTLKANLSINGVYHKRYVHRLVASEFIDNPESKPQVDHIDGNKQNNAVSNLRWCTNEENQQYRVDQMRVGTEINNYEVLYGDIVFPSIRKLAKHIANIRGSSTDTIRKNLLSLRYGDRTLYGKNCAILNLP